MRSHRRKKIHPIKKHALTIVGLSILALCAVWGGYSVVSHPQQATASIEAQLTGWAWSDTIGWISFSGSNYGVAQDANGDLAGYAWSDNVGWIKFATGCPTGAAGQCNSRYTATGLQGWARACAGTSGGSCDTSVDAGGGWDGWISLSSANDHDFSAAGVQTSPHTYGYKKNGQATQNYAWGGTNVGWIDFNQVLYNNVEPDLVVACSPSPSSGYINQAVVWTASVSGGDGTYQYSWSGTDGLSGNNQTANITYTSLGTKTAAVDVTSDGQTLHTECSSNVVINTSLSSSICSPSPTQAGTSTPITWTAAPWGGTGTYDYSWSGTDDLSGNTRVVTKTYQTAGNKSASVLIGSGSGASRETFTAFCGDTQVANSACAIGDVTIPHGESRTFYLDPFVPLGEECVSEVRTCQDDGTLSGSYANLRCSPAPLFNER